MKISIIIPTYNEEKAIEECLNSLLGQTLNDFEVIVVDDGSTDNTSEILRSYHSPVASFQFLKQNHKGAGAARNLGAEKAKGEILVFVDADMTFDKGFLKNLIAPIDSGKVKGTFSKEEIVSNWYNLWAKCWNINEGWEEGKRHPKNYPDTQPVFRAITKSEFDRVGGFTPGGYDDDWSLGRKLGYEAALAPGAIFYHKNPATLSEIFKHAQWVGKRKYKLGWIGYIVALVRSFFPVSIIIGIYKGFKNNNLRFVIFKIIYDFGIFVGIIKFLFTQRSSK